MGILNREGFMSQITDPRVSFLQKTFPLDDRFAEFKNPAKDLFVAIAHHKTNDVFKKIQELPVKILDAQENPRKVTPLQACVIMNDIHTLELLLDQGADPCKQDTSGWTAFHHAALKGNQAMLSILKSFAKDKNCEAYHTSCGKNYLDLEKLLQRSTADSEAPVFKYFDETQVVVGNAQKFFELTGAHFVNESIIRTDYLIECWEKPYREDFSKSLFVHLTKHVEENYASYQKNPPPLYIKKTPVGWGVFTEKNIQPGALVLHYAGEAKSGPAQSAYCAGSIDGKDYSNLGPLVNDGVPSLVPIYANLEKMPYTIVYVALKEIKADSELFTNYGFNHTVKKSPYSCHDFENLQGFLLQHGGLLKVYKAADKLINLDGNQYRTNLEKALKVAYLKAHFSYIFQTPSVLLDLILHASIKVEDLLMLFDREVIGGVYALIPLTPRSPLEAVLKEVIQQGAFFEDQFNKLLSTKKEHYQQLQREIKTFLISLSPNYRLTTRFCLNHFFMQMENFCHPDQWTSDKKEEYLRYADRLSEMDHIYTDPLKSSIKKYEEILALAVGLPEKISLVINNFYLDILKKSQSFGNNLNTKKK